MLLHEYVQRCASCGEATPHSRRMVAVPRVLAALGSIAALACFGVGGEAWLLGSLLLPASLLLFLRDRERCWSIACERCRGRERRRILDTKPTLDGRTTIDV